MGRDTVQLETAVLTITQEYLLEFTSEYGISEDLHPELPDRGDRIVDFPEGKIGMYTKFFEFANFRVPISQFLFDILRHYQIHLSQLSVIGEAKPLDSLKNWNNKFFWVDERVFPTMVAWRISAPKDSMPLEGTYSVEDVAILNARRTPIQNNQKPYRFVQSDQRSKSCRDQNWQPFSYCLLGATANGHREPTDRYGGAGRDIRGDGAEDQGPETMAFVVPPVRPLLTTGVAPNIVEEEEMAADAYLVSKRCRKRANKDSNVNASRKETLAGIMNPDPISFAKPSFVLEQDIAQSSKGATVAGGPEPDPTSPTIVMSPRGIYQLEWGVTNGCRLDTPSSCQELVDHLAPPRYFSELRHLPNEEFLGQFNMTLPQKVAMGSQLRLRFEQEAKLLRKSVAQVARWDQRIQAMKGEKKNLETLLEAEADMRKAAEAKNAELAQVIGEEKIKAAFEEFKKYEDERVSARCVEMDSRLDVLSIDFDEELYPHMLTAIAGRRWVIGHGLRLDVLKCAESQELRQTFANVVSVRITKGFCDGLKYGVEQGEAKLDLAMVEGYNSEAEGKFTATMQALKDLKYPLIDELEKLKDAPMDMKIPVYPEVRDPQDPWAVKEEMLLEDAIAANMSRAKKNKKCKIVCHTHDVGSTHHARSDGVPASVPTAVPQGLAILLADVAT
ncbi:hypothetical protein Tco_0861949 [Tanacetum coccineum]